MKSKVIGISSALTLALTATPLFAYAQITTVCGLLNLIEKGARLFGTLIAILAVIFLLYSAFLFITGGGNEETRKSAREYLVYAIIGIAIALLATAGVPIVRDFLQSGSLVSECGGTLPR